MFSKVHKKLTFLCIGLIVSVLTIMSLIYLIVSERNLKESHLFSFQNDTNTIMTNISRYEIMTPYWFNVLEFNEKYMVSIYDNNIPLWICNRFQDPQRDALFEETYKEYMTRYQNYYEGSYWNSYPATFSFTSKITKQTYFSYFNIIEKENTKLTVFVLYPLHNLERQIINQRFYFLLIDLIAIFILSHLAYFLTLKILNPIEENRKEQSRFIASASHELRTPLAVILSSSNACRRANEQERDIFLHTIETEGIRMSRLITDMLTLAKADSLVWSINKVPVDLDTLLLNSYESFESLTQEKNIDLRIILPDESIPPCHCDADRISQVMAVFLYNALSYTPSGGYIHIILTVSDKYAQIQVKDSGIGIPDEEKNRIFERFYRVDSSHNEKEHFGLGLCIAAEIIQAHHGSIKIKDTPGGGSTFLCKLPL